MSVPASGSRDLLVRLLLAALVVLVLATRSSLDFDRVRVRVVPMPRSVAEGRLLDVPASGLEALENSWVAVVVRVRAPAERDVALGVTLDREPIGNLVLAPDESRRMDGAVFLAPGARHTLSFSANRDGWWLEYVEIANVHGFSSGLFRFVIVPGRRHVPAPVPAWCLPIVLAALLVQTPVLAGRQRRLLTWVHGALAGIVLALLAAVLVAPLVSPYRVLISLSTLASCTAVLYAVPLARLGRGSLLRVRASPLLRWVPHAAAAALLAWMLLQFYEPDTGFTRLIGFGEAFQATSLPALRATPRAVTSPYGYDGQFYAQLALDPLLRSPEVAGALDAPAYRARRILMSWTAFIVGLGRPWMVLQAYALINVVAWALLACVLLAWLPAGAPKPVLAWLAAMMSHGLLASIRHALPDGPSVLLLALSVLAVERGRRWVAAGTLAAAGLTRETNLLGAVILAPGARRDGRAWRRAACQLAVVTAPIVAWGVYLWMLDLPAHDVGRRNFAAPVTAFCGAWAAAVEPLGKDLWSGLGWAAILTLVALTVQLVHLIRYRDADSPWWRLGIVYGALMLVLGPAVWEGYPGAVTRVVLPMTIAFNVRVVRSRRFAAWWIAGNANAPAGLHEMGVDLLWPFH